ncbi:MAG: hypothetical protein AAF998_25545 [Bacteroidota bacterium]
MVEKSHRSGERENQPLKPECLAPAPYFVVPVELAEHVLREGIAKSFRTFILLKFYSNGTINRDRLDNAAIMRLSGCKDIRTFEGHLDQLEERGMINRSKRLIFLRSFDFIRVHLEFQSSTSFLLHPEHLDHLQETLFAAVIGGMLRFQEKVRWLQARKKRRANQSGHRHFSYPAVSLTLAANKTGLSRTRTSQLKTKAIQIGLLSSKPHYRRVNLREAQVRQAKAHAPETVRRIRFINGQFFEQLTDELHCHLILKKRRNRKNVTHRKEIFTTKKIYPGLLSQRGKKVKKRGTQCGRPKQLIK